MKVAHADSHVLQSSGLQETHGFRIKASPHAFKILSSGLYSDKIGAVMREVGCNAADAHAAIGLGHMPFEVKLPNKIDQDFYIRDYGPGLSHDEVINLYTTYFASTKQDSNDFTGAFGLGSKSPFSYTDTFNVTSSQNRERRMYSCYLGENGLPTISQMGDPIEIEPTDPWQHGLQVSFPVQVSDHDAFQKAAQKYYCLFNPFPVILGGKAIEPLNIIKDMGDYALYNNNKEPVSQYYYNRQPVEDKVQMGNVWYPLTISKLGLSDTPEFLANYTNPVLAFKTMDVTAEIARRKARVLGSIFESGYRRESSLIIRVPMGTVQVAASREELQYDPATKKVIIDILMKIVVDSVKKLEHEYSQFESKTWAERRAVYADQSKTFDGLYFTADSFAQFTENKDPGWAKKIAAFIEDHTVAPSWATVTGAQVQILGCHKNKIMTYPVLKYNYNYTIVHGDEPGAYRRARNHILQRQKDYDHKGSERMILVHRTKAATTRSVALQLLEVQKQLSGIATMKLADLDMPPAIMRIKRGKSGQGLLPMTVANYPGLNAAKIVKYNGSAHAGWDISTTPDDEKYYIIRTTRAAWGYIKEYWDFGTHRLDSWRINDVLDAIKQLNKELDLKIPFPVELPSNAVRTLQLDKRPDWQQWTNYLREELVKPEVLSALKGKKKDTYPAVVMINKWNLEGASFLESCRWMYKHAPDLWKEFSKELKIAGKYNTILQIIEANERGLVDEEANEGLIAYRNVINRLNLGIDIPERETLSHKVDVEVPSEFFSVPMMERMLKLDKKAFHTLVSKALKVSKPVEE